MTAEAEVCDGRGDLEAAIADLAERLPEPLLPLARLTFNYRWTWLPGGSRLFRDIDPGLWKRSGCNPRFMVEAASPRRLLDLAADAEYVARVTRLAAALDADLRRPAAAGPLRPARPVAYFCSEFGAHCSLPLYGGGLGVLAGDVLKAASDLALPLVGVGLAYRQGYFHQRIGLDGQQHEYWISADFERLPAVRVTGPDQRPLTVEVEVRGRAVRVRIWRVDFGRVPLYLLDSDCEDNHPIDRWITARLYIGDRHTRLAQYALLGPGGVRALAALGIEPAVVHLNEGHAALGTFQRLGERLAAGEEFDQALAQVRATTVFTTHTPVPAGNEWYASEELEPVVGGLARHLGIPPRVFYGLGRFDPEDVGEPVHITPLALRTSRAANGVSRRHGEVAREMWQRLWPERDLSQVPIGHVTNGVHTTSWMAEPMQELLDRHLPADWRDRPWDPACWSAVAALPDPELWAVRRTLRARLVEYAREHSVFHRLSRGEAPDYVEAANRMFDPDVFTVGFARRVATYKRLYLLVHRIERALALLENTAQPVQVVLAGKAHPADREAKETLRRVLEARRAPHVGSRIVFLEDYDLHAAPRIVAGVDLWLNLPRPPFEASGTSGMKVVLNGGLNLSVLDGWWAEAWDGECGWAIASPAASASVQDDHDANALFDLLEREVIPCFYERDGDGLPRRWLGRVKTSMERLIPRFSAARMLREYAEQLYAGTPAEESPRAAVPPG